MNSWISKQLQRLQPLQRFPRLQLFAHSNTADTMPGGLRLPRNKPGLPVHQDIPSLAIPSQLKFPLLDYHYNELTPNVKVGDVVTTGDALAEGILASCGGEVVAITAHRTIHPAHHSVLCVVLQTNKPNKEQIDPDTPITQPTIFEPSNSLTHQRIQQSGIVGLGGAGFKTASKLLNERAQPYLIDTLIVNAVECEPLISCDESLMTVDAHGVVLAIRSMIDLTECDRCLLAIEEDKTTAIANLRHALANLPYDNSAKTRVPIELTTITPIYPSGAERVLIHRLTGHNAQSYEYPAQIGIVCLNVATIHAAWQAQQGYAMTSRIITIAGSQAHNPCNVRVHLGTSIEQILQATGNTVNTAQHRVRAGGPLSGFDLIDLDVPVTATTNCIAIEAQREAKPAQPCIRCGECSDVCPASLLPQQLYWYAQTNEIEQANRFGLNQCIECGCCDLVCPSQIPLTQSFRHSKAIARQQLIETKAANDAKQRFEQRQIRLDRIAQEQASQRERQKRTLQEEKDDMAQSLERARLRRKQRGNRDNPSLDSDNKSTSQATQASKTQGNPTGNNSS